MVQALIGWFHCQLQWAIFDLQRPVWITRSPDWDKKLCWVVPFLSRVVQKMLIMQTVFFNCNTKNMDYQNDAHHVSLFHCVLPRKSPWNYPKKICSDKVLRSAASAWTSFLLAFWNDDERWKVGMGKKEQKNIRKMAETNERKQNDKL